MCQQYEAGECINSMCEYAMSVYMVEVGAEK